MCGIAGIIQFEPEIGRDELYKCLKSMADKISHRGPDGEGVWVNDEASAGFSHRRLSIIDLSAAGAQPMWSNDKRYCITFNGEIYNYLEIKNELLKKGVQFATETDTEVLIEAYRQYGENMLDILDGMFSFAIYDSLKKDTFVARDPFGEKPFYYSINNKLFGFSSELDALRIIPGFDDTVDSEELAKYLCLQYFDGESTIYRGAKKLMPGCCARISQDGSILISRYFEFNPKPDYSIRTLDDWSDELEELLLINLERRLRADVPVGAFLSGGVDSSTVVAMATKKLGVPIKTFTIGFEGFSDSEHFHAAEIAEHLGVENNCEMISRETLSRCGMFGDKVDEPNGDTSIFPTYLLSKFAHKHVKVALSGDGADELFGGYGRYMQTLAEEKLTDSANKTAGNRYYSPRIMVMDEDQAIKLTNSRGANIVDYIEGLRNEIDAGNGALLDRLRKTDIRHYLPGAVLAKVDRMSMQNGLEVRTPFLNIPMARFAERIPADMLVQGDSGKRVLKNLASRYMPQSWMDRQKRGFGLPPYQWAGTELLDKAKQQFINNYDQSCWWINFTELSGWISETDKIGGNADYKIWEILHAHDFLKNKGGSPSSNIDIEMYSMLFDKIKELRGFTVGVAFRSNEAWKESFPRIDEMLVLFSCGNNGSKVVDWMKSPVKALDIVNVSKDTKVDNVIMLEKGKPDELFIEGLITKNISQIMYFASGAWEILNLKENVLTPVISEPALFYNSAYGMPYKYKKEKIVDDFKVQMMKTLGVRVKTNDTSMYVKSHSPLIRVSTPRRAIKLFLELSSLVADKIKERMSLYNIVRLYGNGGAALHEKELFSSDRRERIALVISNLSSGGAERQLCNLAIGLKEKGHDVRVITLWKLQGDGTHYKYLLDKHKIPIVSAADSVDASPDIFSKLRDDIEMFPLVNKLPAYIRRSTLHVYAHLVNWDSQVMISFLDHPNIIGGIAGLLARTEVIVNSFRNHNPENFDLHEDWHKRYYRLLNKSGRIIWTGNSNSGNNSYAKWAKINANEISLIRNGINFSEDINGDFDVTRVRNQYGLNGHKVICGVFRLAREKMPMLFLEVVIDVIKQLGNVKVIILGVGSYEIDMKKIVAQNNLEEKIIFLGRKKDVLSYIAASDVVLQTSFLEGTPNSLIEAQYLRKPVVTTHAGGAAEAVDDGKSGYVLPSNVVKPLSDAVIKILSDDEAATKMGNYGHAFVKEKFSVMHMLDEYMDIIHMGTPSCQAITNT